MPESPAVTSPAQPLVPTGDPPGQPSVPPSVRVELAHAAVHRLAELAGADILVLKGPRMDPAVGYAGRASTDVDVLVRPAHLDRLLAELVRHDCRALDRFETGSPFGHSVTYFSPVWGHVDVHRFMPGIELDAPSAFDRLWADRGEARFGGIPVPVPSPAAQALVLVLHAARAGRAMRARADVQHAWVEAPPEQQAAILDLVEQLRAEVAWAAATGGLEALRDRPSYRLWRAVSRDEGRLAEWRGRIAAASTLRAKARLVARGTRVNTDHLSILLGRAPTRREIIVEAWRRVGKAVVETGAALGRRLPIGRPRRSARRDQAGGGR